MLYDCLVTPLKQRLTDSGFFCLQFQVANPSFHLSLCISYSLVLSYFLFYLVEIKSSQILFKVLILTSEVSPLFFFLELLWVCVFYVTKGFVIVLGHAFWCYLSLFYLLAHQVIVSDFRIFRWVLFHSLIVVDQ